MTPLRPHLLRATYDWIVENGLTPYLLVDTETDDVVVPLQFVQDGKIVLNVRPEAVQNLSMGNTDVSFNARFGGQPMRVEFPVSAALAIYAKENGKGMIFEDENGDDVPPSDPTPKTKTSKPRLKVVK